MTETVTITFLTNHEVPLEELPEWHEDPSAIAEAAIKHAQSSSDVQDIVCSPEELAELIERKEPLKPGGVVG